MSFSLAAIRTAYDTLGTYATAVVTAKAAVVALGVRPTAVDITSDGDFTALAGLQANYDTNMAAALATYNAALATQYAKEALVVAAMLLVPDQWVQLTPLSNWGAATEQWIGVGGQITPTVVNGATIYTIAAKTVLPTQNYPLF